MVKKAPLSKLATLLKERDDLFRSYRPGDLIEGQVIGVRGRRIFVAIDGGRFLGVVSSRELKEEGSRLPDYRINDPLKAVVIDADMGDGYVLLSVREAIKNQGWDSLGSRCSKGTVLKAKVLEANRGGLMIEAEGLKGFLPVSQLAPEHYPRVGSDRDAILLRLKQFEGQELEVGVLDLDKLTGKLIFSERVARREEFEKFTSQIKIGDALKGKVTGVVDFGIFVNLGKLEGLVHLSEISWDKVEDVNQFARVGETKKVQVIGIDGDKISLSIKRLIRDPWLDLVKGYSIGQIVDGEVTQIMPFGAKVLVDGKIDGLIHISELSHRHVAQPEEVVQVGDKVKVKIVDIGPEHRRFGLSLKALEEITGAEVETSGLAKLGLSKAVVGKLLKAGIQTAAELEKKNLTELLQIEGIGQASAEKIIKALESRSGG